MASYSPIGSVSVSALWRLDYAAAALGRLVLSGLADCTLTVSAITLGSSQLWRADDLGLIFVADGAGVIWLADDGGITWDA